MKKLLAVLVLFVSFTGFSSTGSEYGRAEGDVYKIYGDLEDGIAFFKGSWAEALKEADKSNKLIFLDAYAAWCGPCKMMAKKTFTKKDVGEFFNEHFINFKMDMEKHEEGPRLSKKYALTAYPTLYFVDENEKIVHQTLGYQSPNDLVTNGRRALDKLTTFEK
jgi:thiol:disulfide interchange protein